MGRRYVRKDASPMRMLEAANNPCYTWENNIRFRDKELVSLLFETLANMVKARKYVVTKHFSGVPKRTDIKIVEEELPPLQDGQILAKAEFISVDLYLRAYNSSKTIPYDQFSYQVAEVIECKHPD
ncbi:Prostaglandin reductase 1 [Eumeta japonica]|uniref:15-oxoprostaglandin 13-reductase n=1 Tax=Eumeta variegata TaxID=151549 RepID=A0A4C1VF15_EUMVA|nr:Prostaglandin reductase 1 [Eumeta japonica]